MAQSDINPVAMCSGAVGRQAECLSHLLRPDLQRIYPRYNTIMKIHSLPGIAAIIAFISTAWLNPLFAGVEKNADGTYTISGTWTYWAEKDLVAPTGKSNDFGAFSTILFKSNVNDFEGMKALKKTFATFKVKGRESGDGTGKALVVEEILERVDGGVPEKPAPPKR